MDSKPQLVSADLLKQIFKSDDDKPLLQDTYVKVGKVNEKERVLVVSSDAIYLLDSRRIIEKQVINQLSHIIKSNNTSEVLLYFKNEKDWILKSTEEKIK